MIRALFTAATGMVGQQMNLDTIANNLANVNTTGFKKSRVNFKDLLYETSKPAGTQTSVGATIPEGIQVGHGTSPSSVAKVFSTGSMVQTGNPLDLAIQGDGFFQIELPDGTQAYTRDGSFSINQNGQVTTADGYPLYPAITIPTNYDQITVGSDGVVSALLPKQSTPQNISTIQLARFPNATGLDARMGRNLLVETQASGAPVISPPGLEGAGLIEQGFLENSNVQVVDEVIQLIVAQRAYEANSKVIQASDEMLQMTNNVLK